MGASVLFVVEQVEHERGWGSRPEGYQCFLTEADADTYIKADLEEERKRNPSGIAPDCYWSNHKVGYREALPKYVEQVEKSSTKRMYADRISDLTKER